MKNLRFICAQPATTYYTWQVEVMINNFLEIGIFPNNIDIVCQINNGITPLEWRKLANHYNTVRFFFYNDTRETKYYTSSVRPNILKQHWLARPELKNDTIFYHDNDIIFKNKIDWSKFLNDDKWYGSDTRWYIAHDYILSKGEDVLNKMCEIVNINKQVIKDNELNAFGTQYILKDIDWKFWDAVERDSEQLFKEITELNKIKVAADEEYRKAHPEEKKQPYHKIQIWCADMWALLWNGWKLGKETICHNDLQFSWGSSTEELWNKYNIFHNAGVVNDKGGLFYKSAYMNRLPYNENLQIKEHTASWHYYQYIQKVGKKSILL
jgi:hypothetical protein